ncbi:MAG: hypothetical protein R8G34_22485 [Paracoccaceae bacterium]|nr:hypothetical protein [Paracoccaceae bacterium]
MELKLVRRAPPAKTFNLEELDLPIGDRLHKLPTQMGKRTAKMSILNIKISKMNIFCDAPVEATPHGQCSLIDHDSSTVDGNQIN